ncbi:MAG: TetR/AcrR family transcriptional regulator C-terminal domain-containing protein [Muricoprocola sp.]
MKHTITSLNTKKMIANSLKKIMCTKPLSKITVSEIIKDCGINRKTFYYHFEDIYALLKWMFEEEAIELVKTYDLFVDYKDALNFIMDYIEQNQHIINCAYDSIGRDEMKRFFYSDFIEIVQSIVERAEKMHQHTLKPEFKQFLCEFYTEALAGIFINWVKNREQCSREEVISYIFSILKSSITAVLSDPQNTI